MKLQQVSNHCFAVINEKNRVGDANSGLINSGGVVVDTQSDLAHARQGSTSEISHRAEDVFAWLGFIAPLRPGAVMGFGTIPDCTGCDHDDFIDPGAEIAITAERLGTLHCRFAEPAGRLPPSRWPVREPLRKYH